MADHSSNHGGAHAHHITDTKVLLRTLVILMFFMFLTIAAAQLPYWMPSVFGFMNSEEPLIRLITNGIALTIAFIKAGLVVQIFMGVKFSTKVVKFYAYGGFIWFTLIFIILIDYFSRPWEPVQGWEKAPSTGLPRDLKRSDGLDPNFTIKRPEKKDHDAH